MATFRRRAGVVVVDGGDLLVVRLRDPHTRIARWFPPGGGIDPGESALQTALRETLEETGYRVEVTGRQVVARYPYRWNDQPYDAESTMLSARLVSPRFPVPVVADESYHEGVGWIPLTLIDEELGFSQPVLEAVRQLL
jgi:tRNA(adenine34) deaminase